VGHVLRRIGDRHQRHHHVALLDVVLDPLLIDGDVALDEVEAIVLRQRTQLVVREVDAIDLPGALLEDRIGERAADEAVRPEDHYLQCHVATSSEPSPALRRVRLRRVGKGRDVSISAAHRASALNNSG